MDKDKIHARFVQQLAQELETLTTAAKHSAAVATDKEHQARSKYETLSLESSYLARGQAKRVKELREALKLLKGLPLAALDAAEPVQLGALVTLSGEDGERVVLVCAQGGGESVCVEGVEVTLVTFRSPLGQALLGQFTGALVDVGVGAEMQSLRIEAVE